MLKKIVFAGVGILLSISAFASPEGETEGAKYQKPGFVTIVEKGRLWVFKEDSKELADFRAHGEPTIAVMKIGEGPEGMTLKSSSLDVIDAYKAAQ